MAPERARRYATMHAGGGRGKRRPPGRYETRSACPPHRAANDEMRVKDHYERALRDGRFLLLVDTPTDARQDRAAEVLREQGAHSVNHMGRFAREEIVPPPERG